MFTVLLYNYLFFNFLNQIIMKKFLLLCSIVICCIGAFAQIKNPHPLAIVLNLRPESDTVVSGKVIMITSRFTNNAEGLIWDKILDPYIKSSNSPNAYLEATVQSSPIAEFYNIIPYTKFYIRTFSNETHPVNLYFEVSMRDAKTGLPVKEFFNMTVNPGSYKNVKKCITFTRNNCPAGQQGTTGSYCVSENTYSSTISQEDADEQAQADIDATTSQALANQILQCKSVYSNVAISNSFTRNNCTGGSVGSAVIYTVAAGKYTSIISQADANAKAQAEITANGQANANNLGVCTFFNGTLSVNFTKNNCPAAQVGSVVPYTVPANKYSSIISLADANSKAQAEANANGQGNANSVGGCSAPIFYNMAMSTTFTKNNCASDLEGTAVTYTVPANKYSSTISQADAKGKALAEIAANGQANANNLGTCVPAVLNGPTFTISGGCTTSIDGTTVTGAQYQLIVTGLSSGQTIEIPAASHLYVRSSVGGRLVATFFMTGGIINNLVTVLVKQNGNIVLTKDLPVTLPTGTNCP